MVREVCEVFGDYVKIHNVFTERVYKDEVQTYHNRNSNYFKQTLDNREILEVSTASTIQIGYGLSAMVLYLGDFSLESLYQSTKVYLQHPDNKHIKYLDPFEAKKAMRIKDTLLGFEYGDITCSLSGGSMLYDWLYMNAVNEASILHKVDKYDLFADIFYNPLKAYNCQARALAAMQVLHRNNLLENSLENFVNFKANMQNMYR